MKPQSTPLFICAFLLAHVMLPSYIRASEPCPQQCECIGFETDCRDRGLVHLPERAEIREDTDTLIMSKNRLDFLTELNLPKLETYYVDQNQLRELKDGAFRHMPNLEKLNLSRNCLSDLNRAQFQSLGKLLWVDLSYNNLTKVVDLQFHGATMRTLERIDLSHNAIRTIEERAFQGLRTLRTLILNHNQINAIDHFHFREMDNLGSFYLHHNNMQFIESRTFSPLKNLKILTLHHNTLRKIDDGGLFNLGKLATLDISDNLLDEIPNKVLCDTPELQVLDLSGNPIPKIGKREFPKELAKLSSLSMRNMSKLTEIHALALDHLANLHYVNISGNPKLTSLAPLLFLRSFHILRDVDLSYNGIVSFDYRLLPWKLLEYVSVVGNPLKCDCDSRWMLNYSFVEGLKCDTPEELKGQMLTDIPFTRLVCEGPHSPVFNSSTAWRNGLAAAALVLSLALISILAYRCRKRIPCRRKVDKYSTLYNIYDPACDNTGVVVVFRGDKVESKSYGMDLEKQMV